MALQWLQLILFETSHNLVLGLAFWLLDLSFKAAPLKGKSSSLTFGCILTCECRSSSRNTHSIDADFCSTATPHKENTPTVKCHSTSTICF